jgi:hypothetical protein
MSTLRVRFHRTDTASGRPLRPLELPEAPE